MGLCTHPPCKVKYAGRVVLVPPYPTHTPQAFPLSHSPQIRHESKKLRILAVLLFHCNHLRVFPLKLRMVERETGASLGYGLWFMSSSVRSPLVEMKVYCSSVGRIEHHTVLIRTLPLQSISWNLPVPLPPRSCAFSYSTGRR